MSEVRLPRLLVSFVMVFVIAGCAHHDRPAINNSGVCRSGVAAVNRQAPIVCVNDMAAVLSVSPDPVEANDVLEGPRTEPVMLHWYTVSGKGTLGVQVHGTNCVARIDCESGHCWAKTIPRSTGTCKYDVWTTPWNKLDPTIIINPCCP